MNEERKAEYLIEIGALRDEARINGDNPDNQSFEESILAMEFSESEKIEARKIFLAEQWRIKAIELLPSELQSNDSFFNESEDIFNALANLIEKHI